MSYNKKECIPYTPIRYCTYYNENYSVCYECKGRFSPSYNGDACLSFREIFGCESYNPSKTLCEQC